METQPIKTALVGFGFSGSVFHAPFLEYLPEFDMDTVVSSNPRKVLDQLDGVKVVGDLDSVLLDPEIKLVVIATPVACHYEQTKACLLAGKDVVTDKTFTRTVEEAQELIEISQQQHRLLTVYHNRRWDCDFQTVQKVIESQCLGDIYLYEAHFHRFRPTVQSERWKENGKLGSGTLYDLGSHLIDQALQLFGEPDEIISDVKPQRPGALATDYFHLTLKYQNKRVILKSSSLVAKAEPKYIIHGDKGSYFSSEIDPQEAYLMKNKKLDESFFKLSQNTKPNSLHLLTDHGNITQQDYPTVPSDYSQFYRSLARAIYSHKAPPVEPTSLLNVIKIIQRGIS